MFILMIFIGIDSDLFTLIPHSLAEMVDLETDEARRMRVLRCGGNRGVGVGSQGIARRGLAAHAEERPVAPPGAVQQAQRERKHLYPVFSYALQGLAIEPPIRSVRWASPTSHGVWQGVPGGGIGLAPPLGAGARGADHAGGRLLHARDVHLSAFLLPQTT